MIAVAAVGSDLARGVADVSQMATGSLVAAIWQGFLLAGAAWLGLKLLPKTPAAVRFAIWFGVFALVVALPMISAWPRAAGVAPATGQHGAWLNLDMRWSLAIAGVWLLASVWRAGQLMVAAARVRGLWRRAMPVAGLEREGQDEGIGATTHPSRYSHEGWATRLVRKVELCVSDEIDKPTVIGFFAPKILIPAWLLEKLTPTELEQIVLHESGHLGRADDWLNLLQKIALVIFPLNPALAWVERRLCFERELACDEWVLRGIADRPGASTAYAACLASMAEYRLERRGLVRGLALALGLLGRESELTRRVKRILRRGEGMRPAHAKLVLGGAMLGLVVGAAGLERCPQLVGFTQQGTGASEQAAVAKAPAAFGYQPVTLRSKGIPVQQFRSIGDAPANMAHVRAASKVRPETAASSESLLQAPAANDQRERTVAAEKVDVTQRSRNAWAQAPRMVRTLQHGTRQSQDGDVVITQWVTVTQWRDGDGTRMVMTTARSLENGGDQQRSMQDSGQQPVVPYAAVPVRGGWLVFQL